MERHCNNIDISNIELDDKMNKDNSPSRNSVYTDNLILKRLNL